MRVLFIGKTLKKNEFRERESRSLSGEVGNRRGKLVTLPFAVLPVILPAPESRRPRRRGGQFPP